VAVAGRWHGVAGDLTDHDWERLEPLLPSMKPQRGGRRRDHRQVIIGILWRIDNGAKWDPVPERYGPAKTCYDRFARSEQHLHVDLWSQAAQLGFRAPRQGTSTGTPDYVLAAFMTRGT
jgi:transposase